MLYKLVSPCNDILYTVSIQNSMGHYRYFSVAANKINKLSIHIRHVHIKYAKNNMFYYHRECRYIFLSFSILMIIPCGLIITKLLIAKNILSIIINYVTTNSEI